MSVKVPSWIYWSLFWVGIISAVLITICIYILASPDRTTINIITIIGTVLGVVGIGMAIYQQIQLISVSEAIKETTVSIQEKIGHRTFQYNLDRCVTCIDKMLTYLHDDTSHRVHDKLEELSDCMTECKKILTIYNNENPNKDANFDERISSILKYKREIGEFKMTILCSKYSKESIGDLKDFVGKINEIQNFLEEIRTSQLYKIIEE